jgi:hypothetical protein
MSHIDIDSNVLRKAVVTLTIQKTLLDIGKPVYDGVLATLENEHGCFLPDCYEHPEYLNNALEKLYGNACSAITESITEQLEQISYQPQITRFVEVISA